MLPWENNFVNKGVCVCALVTQSCLTLCEPMDCSPPGSSVHGDSPGQSTGVGCHALLQGIFPTQESNPGLLHCRQILYQLSHQGSQLRSPGPKALAGLSHPCRTLSLSCLKGNGDAPKKRQWGLQKLFPSRVK